MKHTWEILSCATSLVLAALWLGIAPGQSLGQQAPVLVNPVGANANAAADAPAGPIALGHPFEKLSEGISFRPPADCVLVQQASAEFLSEWADADRDWTLKIAKMQVDPATPLVTTDNYGQPIEGLLNQTVKKLEHDLRGSKILRDDVTNTQDSLYVDAKRPQTRDNVGLIAIRYKLANGQVRLSQQAIIRTAGGLYYLITFTTPGSKADVDGQVPDPGEALAADTFGHIIDSVRLLDRSGIKKEQDDRLYNTRVLVLDIWKGQKYRKLPLVNEQWLRIIKDGKDIGYSYITEDQAGGVPRPLTRQELDAGKRELDIAKATPGDGILIGVRTRLTQDGMRSNKTRGPIQTDAASWFFVSADRKHEDFSRVVVTDDHIAAKKGYIQEFGVSDKRSRIFAEPVEPEKSSPDAIVIPKKNEVVLRYSDDWTLDVNQAGERIADPVQRKLPPYYLAQALGHLLPRLLPLNKPQGYMFATYVSEAREVMMRYIDVLPEQTVVFDGQTLHAFAIQDRIGLEGSITVHYVTVDGRYVGSENKDQKLMMIPTDDGTLRHIWADANLTRPNGIDRGTPANADAIGPRQTP